MHIRYAEQKGRIKISYRLEHLEYTRFPHAEDVEEKAVWLDWRSIGFVPRRVRRSGKKAIAAWALEACSQDMEQLLKDVEKRYTAQEERMRMKERPISLLHPDGQVLKGRVVYKNRYRGRVVMVEPFSLRSKEDLNVPCKWAAFGVDMFKWDGSLSERGLELAHKQLAALYDRELRRRAHGRAQSLAADLNRTELAAWRKANNITVK